MEHIFLDAKILTAIRGRKRLSVRDAQASVKLSFDPELSRHAVFEATRDVGRFLGIIRR